MRANKRSPAPTHEPAFHDLRVADVMQRELVHVRASDSLEEVERVLADARVSGVPVLDDDGNMLGVLSTKDIVRRLAEDAEVPEGLQWDEESSEPDDTEPVAFRRASGGPCAGDLMTTDVACVASDTELVEVARAMVSRDVHRLMVVDRGRLVGIVTTMDVLRPIAGLPPSPNARR